MPDLEEAHAYLKSVSLKGYMNTVQNFDKIWNQEHDRDNYRRIRIKLQPWKEDNYLVKNSRIRDTRMGKTEFVNDLLKDLKVDEFRSHFMLNRHNENHITINNKNSHVKVTSIPTILVLNPGSWKALPRTTKEYEDFDWLEKNTVVLQTKEKLFIEPPPKAEAVQDKSKYDRLDPKLVEMFMENEVEEDVSLDDMGDDTIDDLNEIIEELEEESMPPPIVLEEPMSVEENREKKKSLILSLLKENNKAILPPKESDVELTQKARELANRCYWYRPNVLKRKWGSYRSIHNNQYYDNYNDYIFNKINNIYDPDNGEDYYFEEDDDVDLHPDNYTDGTFYKPDIEIDTTDRLELINLIDIDKTKNSIIEDVDVNMKMNQLDIFDDPNINEYKNEQLIDIETDDNIDTNDKELQEELPLYELISPEDTSDILTYTSPVTKILQKAGIDASNEAEMAKQLLEIRDIIRENNRQNIDEYIKAQEEGLIINGSIIKEKSLLDIKEDKIPQILEEIKDKAMEEEIEIHKDEKEPDRNIILPKPPRENRHSIKEWIDKK
ncbi:hypothetical protein CL6EHI_145300 [Entamoeba histolytica]|uniref:Uncharacterized protein n=2 Tax=Entamoeba histolytica TaxID=5759 RepID=B1N3Y8_ENTH1|nr:hypothetical protein EHI_145300 [Entamoeba histolytica HM-1:IMSS]EDS89315.1 hypothetical protein EHI_145300 [Entamoeba histolytica HM-1:IMSS]GAT97050.1 hypothetical protein CL6EHI_145300 [Entamoeba histolytica]|eukprot:XP_001913904.1 hypothetical protein EHI_145300 [Entamoeba histolytica HM-1:IMSS]